VSHHRETVTADSAPEAVGPYSHAIVSRGFVYCSGQIPLDPSGGELVDGGAGEQTLRCLENLAAVCDAAGASLADAVRLTVYLTDLEGTWGEVNEAYGGFFERLGGDPPARLALGVAALPKGAQVEIEAVVALPD
jgi:2-iminobutanoate/2-iminopropanoate deaminase